MYAEIFIGNTIVGLFILFIIVLSLLQIYFLSSAFRSFKLNSFIEKSAGIRNLIVGVILILVSLYPQVLMETALSLERVKSEQVLLFGNIKFILYLIIVIGFGGIYVFYKSLKKSLKYLIATTFLIP